MVVFTNGCFDLCHVGHVSLLRFCRKLAGQAGRVIVGINSDASVARLKGPDRPIRSAPLRVASIYLLNLVDHVVVFEDEPTELIASLRPDVLVKGAEYFGRVISGAEFAGEVVFAPMMPGVSTTAIIEQSRCVI